MLPKILSFWIFFEPIMTQSRFHLHQSFVQVVCRNLELTLFCQFWHQHAVTKIKGWVQNILEPILVPLLNCFVHISGTSRWWSGQSNLFCILVPAEKLCTHDQKIAQRAIFLHTNTPKPTPTIGCFKSYYDPQADRACGTEISSRSFVVSFVILYVCNIIQFWYLTFCHYVSS
jgi:hypothetical protein